VSEGFSAVTMPGNELHATNKPTTRTRVIKEIRLTLSLAEIEKAVSEYLTKYYTEFGNMKAQLNFAGDTNLHCNCIAMHEEQQT